jgi:hypothetical protein
MYPSLASRILAAVALAALPSVLTSGCKNDAPAAPPAPAPTAAAPAPAPGAPSATPAPHRRAIDCAAILKGSAEHGAAYKSSGWGKLPAELQILPAGAELCGGGSPYAGKDDTYPGVLVRSAIFGASLGELYAPAIARLGCTMKPLEVVGSDSLQSTRIHFRCPGGKAGDIGTDTGYEFYFMSMAL